MATQNHQFLIRALLKVVNKGFEDPYPREPLESRAVADVQVGFDCRSTAGPVIGVVVRLVFTEVARNPVVRRYRDRWLLSGRSATLRSDFVLG